MPRGAERVRRVGVLLQGESATAFTVREQVVLGLGLDGAPVASALGSVDGALGRIGSPRGGRTANRAPVGRRVAADVARAGARRQHGLLLLDEPTNHLDPARRASCWPSSTASAARSPSCSRRTTSSARAGAIGSWCSGEVASSRNRRSARRADAADPGRRPGRARSSRGGIPRAGRRCFGWWCRHEHGAPAVPRTIHPA